MQLVEQGKLQLQTPIHDILPDIKELENGYKTPITLHQLITHTAGMSYPFFNHDTKKWVSRKLDMPDIHSANLLLRTSLRKED